MARNGDTDEEFKGFTDTKPMADLITKWVVGSTMALAAIGYTAWILVTSDYNTYPNGPIPVIKLSTVQAGAHLFSAENCRQCHRMASVGGGFGPDLTHEGQRHDNIKWQIKNITHHEDLFSASAMPDVTDLNSKQVYILALYLASRQ
jgi:mono/diheme cytochrome c family protein